jgi:LCP family protein required for cell wall assembly
MDRDRAYLTANRRQLPERQAAFRHPSWHQPVVPRPRREGPHRREASAQRTPRARRLEVAAKAVVVTLAASVFIMIGIAWSAKQWVNDKIRQVPALDPNSSAIVDKDKQAGDENFLLVGSDTRAGANPRDNIGDADAVPGARSDTLMIAHIPADRSRVVAVSIPRDLEVNQPACEGWDPVSGNYNGQTTPAADRIKINSVYETGGPLCTTRVVQQLSGLSINHYIGIDFNGFKSMVDAVAGVQLCVAQPVRDDILGTIVDQPGQVTLSGDQALNFVRARHVRGDPTSDYGRIRRQQKFISALMREAMSNQVLLDPGKLNDFVNAFAANTFGDNLGVDQLLTLGQSLHSLDAGRVTFVTVPTTGEPNARGNEELRVEDTLALFRTIIDGTPLPGEKPAAPKPAAGSPGPAGSPPAMRPQDVKVQVLNGTDRAGMAGQAARDLQAAGFNIVKVDNANERVAHTVIRYSSVREAYARSVAAAVPGAGLEVDPTMGTALELVLGSDFGGRITPADGASPPSAPLPEGLSTVNAADTACA